MDYIPNIGDKVKVAMYANHFGPYIIECEILDMTYDNVNEIYMFKVYKFKDPRQEYYEEIYKNTNTKSDPWKREVRLGPMGEKDIAHRFIKVL